MTDTQPRETPAKSVRSDAADSIVDDVYRNAFEHTPTGLALLTPPTAQP